MNMLDCVALLSIAQYLIVGFMFIANNDISQGAEDVLVVSLLITTVATMALGLYYIFRNYQLTKEAYDSTNELVNHTVGCWWKVTLGLRETMNIDEFYRIVGGTGQPDVSTDRLQRLVERAQVHDVLGDAMGLLLVLLLDANCNGKVSSEELYQHLWLIPGIHNDDKCGNQAAIDLVSIDTEIERRYLKSKWPSPSTARNGLLHRSMTGETFSALITDSDSKVRDHNREAASLSTQPISGMAVAQLSASIEFDNPTGSSYVTKDWSTGRFDKSGSQHKTENFSQGRIAKESVPVCGACQQRLVTGCRFCHTCGKPASKNEIMVQLQDLQEGIRTPVIPCTPRKYVDNAGVQHTVGDMQQASCTTGSACDSVVSLLITVFDCIYPSLRMA